MAGGDLLEFGSDDVAERARLLEHALVLEDVDGRHRRRTRERVTGVREPPGIDPLVEGGGDRVRNDDAAERDVPRVHAFGEADQVRANVPVLDREPFATPPESGHDLVGDEHDAVLIAQCPDPGEVAGGRHENAVRTHHRLEDDRGDGVRTFEHDELGEVRQRAFTLFGFGGGVKRRSVEVRTEVVDHTGYRRFARPPARVARHCDRRGGTSVVAAVRGEHLVSTGVQAGHTQGILGRFGAAVGKEHLVHFRWRDLGDQSGGLTAVCVRVERRNGAEPTGGFLDRRDELRVLMA